MSKLKKKNMKKPTRLRVLAASLMMIVPLSHSATTTFSDYPLVGVSETFAPHVALALSVEFPTAGAAYNDTEFDLTTDDAKKTYRGYFDSNKCYRYDTSVHGGAFIPDKKASTDADGNIGLCDGKTYSGNLLNFMTMTAIDVFRSTMTGGNRAKGTGSDATTYAETNNETFLRRANVVKEQNGMQVYRLTSRVLKVGNRQSLARRLVPSEFVSNSTSTSTGTPLEQGYKSLVFIKGYFYDRYRYDPGLKENVRTVNQPVGDKDEFVDPNGSASDIVFKNNGFGLTVNTGVRELYMNASGSFWADRRFNYGHPAGSYWLYTKDTVTWRVPDQVRIKYEAVKGDSKTASYNVVVKVCDPTTGVESNCVQYGSNYKPEGLMQKYTRDKDMRFATFGYLNQAGNDIDGGVLRSRMKKLIDDPANTDKAMGHSNVVYGNEWNTNTGILESNPDTTDASKSGVTNSGTINYLNKFGDKSGYKTNDPAAELYYTALAYLMNSGAPYQSRIQSALTSNPNANDNFPVILDWDDPYKRGINDKQYQCHENFIIFIGDTNTHEDREVPGLAAANSGNAIHSDQPTNQLIGSGGTRTYLERLISKEGNPFGIWENRGSNNSPAAMAGLAYWARVNDIRPDIQGTQNGNNFIIDVVEDDDYKVGKNTYYLAAKYGGFTRNIDKKAEDGKTTNAANKESPTDARESWTDDPAGTSTVRQFGSLGTPRNYAVANNPDAMVNALEKAMMAGGAANNPSQAATGLSVVAGQYLDFTNNKKPVVLQSTYNFAQSTGDVVAYDLTYIGQASGQQFDFMPKWRAGENLTSTYHGASKYSTRKIWTMKGNQAYDFNLGSASIIFAGVNMPNGITPFNLAQYVMGNNALEGTTFRTRTSLMGTVINSTAMPILPVSKAISGCKYANLTKAETRNTYYAVSANDGMLHIFDANGTPRVSYLASTAVAELPAFATLGYKHKYLNDGTPVVEDACVAGTAKTVLLGTTGRGGKLVYALDVTDLDNDSDLTSNKVMWEFKHDDLGLTVSQPIITKAPDGRSLAIVSSGYNNESGKGSIFILDIAKSSSQAWVKDSNYWQIELGDSGVGAPFAYDEDSDGIADKIFVGDASGKMWQIDRDKTNSSGVAWNVAYNKQPLFTPSTEHAHPISGAPYAEIINGKLMVVVGTGQYFSKNDLSATQQNYAYGFIADGRAPVNEANLLQQQITATPLPQSDKVKLDTTRVSVYKISEHPIEERHQGWRLQLLPGQNISEDASIFKRQVAEFTALRMSNEISLTCERSGATGFISVDVKTGGLNKKPIFDTNGDGLFNTDDESVGLYEINGVTTSQSTHMSIRTPTGSIKRVARVTDGTKEGSVLKNSLDSQAGVRRISWREIF